MTTSTVEAWRVSDPDQHQWIVFDPNLTDLEREARSEGFAFDQLEPDMFLGRFTGCLTAGHVTAERCPTEAVLRKSGFLRHE